MGIASFTIESPFDEKLRRCDYRIFFFMSPSHRREKNVVDDLWSKLQISSMIFAQLYFCITVYCVIECWQCASLVWNLTISLASDKRCFNFLHWWIAEYKTPHRNKGQNVYTSLKVQKLGYCKNLTHTHKRRESKTGGGGLLPTWNQTEHGKPTTKKCFKHIE